MACDDHYAAFDCSRLALDLSIWGFVGLFYFQRTLWVFGSPFQVFLLSPYSQVSRLFSPVARPSFLFALFLCFLHFLGKTTRSKVRSRFHAGRNLVGPHITVLVPNRGFAVLWLCPSLQVPGAFIKAGPFFLGPSPFFLTAPEFFFPPLLCGPMVYVLGIFARMVGRLSKLLIPLFVLKRVAAVVAPVSDIRG